MRHCLLGLWYGQSVAQRGNGAAGAAPGMEGCGEAQGMSWGAHGWWSWKGQLGECKSEMSCGNARQQVANVCPWFGADPIPCWAEGLIFHPDLYPSFPACSSQQPSPSRGSRGATPLPQTVPACGGLCAVCMHPEGVLPPVALCPSATSAGLEGSPASALSPTNPILYSHLPRAYPLSPTLGWGQKQRGPPCMD